MSHHDDHKHHILDNKLSLKVFLGLLVLTFITVAASKIHLGGFMNFVLAMLIASVKAFMVVSFFMGLKYDNNENRTIFGSSLFFVAIFFTLTSADLFTRGDVKVSGPIMKQAASKVEKPWIETEALLGHGKELFVTNCASCHGEKGMGDGPAGLALKARNFHNESEWKNGFKSAQIFGTLTAGLNLMPSFSTLAADDRWALAHYVRTMTPSKPESTDEDLKKVGVDAKGGGMTEVKKRTIPVEFATERYLEESR